jgi:hypothetical protein
LKIAINKRHCVWSFFKECQEVWPPFTVLLPIVSVAPLNQLKTLIQSILCYAEYIVSHVVAMFAYWHRLENVHENSLLHHAFKDSTLLSTNGINSWFSTIDYLKNKIGLNFNACKNMKTTKFKSELKKRLRQFFSRTGILKDVGKLSTYFDIKDNFHIEKYTHTY